MASLTIVPSTPFNRTYEELKLFDHKQPVYAVNAFNRTYEELK